MKKLTLLSLLFLTLFACRKDIDETNVVSEVQDPPVTTTIDYEPDVIDVTATLFGTVNDENGVAVSDASVQLGTYTTTTDDNGRFIFTDITMNQAGTYVEVKQNGYFPGSHRFFPENGSVNYTSIVLLTKTNKGNFNSTEGGLITDAEGISIEFPANSIITAGGSSYEGTVEVYARWIDPTADNLVEIMPGNLQGVMNTNNSDELEEVSLASYGMMAVELESPGGQSLNLGNGQNATLTFPVPAELLADAPAEIPLWSFNETYGIWVEEGSASLQGDKYVGEVSHFSFWNCDYPYPLINLSGTIVSPDGNPVSNAWVRLTMNNGATGWAFTDGNGMFSGKVPKDEEFTMEVGQYFYCDEVWYTDDIGPFSSDTDLGNITIDPGDNLVDITGTVVDCNGNPVTNGLVEITFENAYPRTYVVNDGTIEAAILNCSDTTTIATVVATNLDDFEQSDVLSFTVVDPLDLGTIDACGNVLDEYLIFTVDGIATTFLDVSFVNGGPDSSFINAFGAGGDYNIFIGLDGVDAVGTYTGDVVTWASMFVPGNNTDYFLQCTGGGGQGDCGFDEIIITQYGNVGETILGTFSGEAEFNDNGGNIVVLPFTGEFKVIRD